MSINNIKLTLSSSLLTLLDQHKFKDITTEMICSHSGISRSTFYRHFRDKQELILWELSNHIDSLSGLLPDEIYLDNYYVFTFTFMNSKRDYFKKLIKIGGQNSYEDYMFQQVVFYLSKKILKKTGMETIDSTLEYSIEIFAQGAVYAALKWIKGGFVETPEQMTEILCLSMPSTLKKYFLK